MLRVLAALVMLVGLGGAAHGSSCPASFTVENHTTAPPSVGQSFTAPYSGTLVKFTVKADNPNPGLVTVRLYNGESVAAPDLLRTETGHPALVNGENIITLTTPLPVVDDQLYTFLLTNESANGTRLRYDVANSYPCGMATAGAGFVPGSDIWFRLGIVAPKQAVPGLSGGAVALLMLSILALSINALRNRT